jgi:hypothetical protein
MLQSNTLGTPRTITCAAFSGVDIDFRDITIAGAAAPISGTRFGDCKGNSGITFPDGVPKYWKLAAGGNWSSTAWAITSGGTAAVNNFPLAQDTAWIESANLNSGATITMNAAYNVGTINMSGRTTNTMIFATGTTTPFIYGDWVNGSGVTISGTGIITFSGRGSQTLTSAGAGPFTGTININTPGGSVTLADALVTTSSISLDSGTFNANDKNITAVGISTSNSNVRTFALGSGILTLTSSGAVWNVGIPTNLTVTGTGTIKMTSASAKTFTGGGVNYSGITIDQAGAGTLTISGNNTFKDITNTYGSTGATSIILNATTQTLSQFTATGTVGNVLTISGTSATSPASLIYTGTSDITSVDYITANNILFYVPDLYWKIGTNSRGAFYGAYLLGSTIISSTNSNFFLFF